MEISSLSSFSFGREKCEKNDERVYIEKKNINDKNYF
jgi:hypothetical protein